MIAFWTDRVSKLEQKLALLGPAGAALSQARVGRVERRPGDLARGEQSTMDIHDEAHPRTPKRKKDNN